MLTLREWMRGEPRGLGEEEALETAVALGDVLGRARARGISVGEDLLNTGMTDEGALVLPVPDDGRLLPPSEDVPALGKVLAFLLVPSTQGEDLEAMLEKTGFARARLIIAAAVEENPSLRGYPHARAFAAGARKALLHLRESATRREPLLPTERGETPARNPGNRGWGRGRGPLVVRRISGGGGPVFPWRAYGGGVTLGTAVGLLLWWWSPWG